MATPLLMSTSLPKKRTPKIDSALVRTRLPKSSEIFGKEPDCFKRNNISCVPKEDAEKITLRTRHVRRCLLNHELEHSVVTS